MKFHVTCPTCGHQATAYKHKLSKPLVSALRQLVKFYEECGGPCNLQKDLDLTKNQYNNFQKLQYFDAVQRIEAGWFPTTRGIAFIKGKTGLPLRVATIESEVLPEDHEVWLDSKVQPTNVWINEIDDVEYKKRPEYQEEKSTQTTLF